MRRPLVLFLIAAACALIARLIPASDPAERLEHEALRLQERVNDRQRELELAIGQLAAMNSFPHALPEGLHSWSFRGDSLLRWSGTALLPDDSARAISKGHVRIGNSIFLSAASDRPAGVHALAEVWNEPPFTNTYLHASFHPSLHAPHGLIALSGAGMGPVVRDPKGDVMFRIAWAEDAIVLAGSDILKLALYLLAAVLLVMFCWDRCTSIAGTRGAWSGACSFLLVIAALRYVSLWLYPIAPFDRLPLFGPELYAASSWLPSLGDLLIDAVLVVVVARFVHIRLREAAFPQGSRAMVPAFLFIALVLAFGWWITQAFIGLVEDSSVDLDLFHLQDLNAYSAVALLCVAFLFAAWALLADALARMVAHTERLRPMLMAGSVAVLLSVVLHDRAGIVDMILVLWAPPLLAILLHGRRRGYRLMHALLALGVVAFLGSHVLIKYTERRGTNERRALAERLVTSDDPVVELLFRDAAPRLRNDAQVYALLTDTSGCTGADLEAHVRQEYFTGYWERYDVRIFAFGTDGELRCATSGEPPRSLNTDGGGFSRTVAAVDMPELFIDASPGERTFYHARVAVMAADTTPPAQLVIELHPRIATEGQGFPELLLNDAGGLSRRVGRYAFARYEGAILMEQRDFAFPLRWNEAMGDDHYSRTVDRGMDLLAYGDPARSLVVLGTPMLSWIDRATTFSWLFAFFGLALTLAIVVSAIMGRNGLRPLGIGTKVRVALLTFAALGLMLFGLGAQRLLTRLVGDRNDAALLEKSRSLLVDMRQKLGSDFPEAGSPAYLEHLLVKASTVFFTDINLYTPDGRLLATSRPQVFEAGLLGRRMNAEAYAALGMNGRSEFTHDERIGDAEYRAAYMPLRDEHGRLLAYIDLPSFARQNELDQERGALFTAIINLLVLLLALSLLAGIFISGWTTRPLELLKRGLSRIALQGVNEPIAYHGRDEVGELVKVYNRKVEELRESADKLARSERESAWKEMARQVAHEIKNPLTPMRLSVQHFERTWDPKSSDANEKLERFTQGMVQQIDALSRIAGEFSAFAQMPQPQGTVFDLREVAKAGVALFAGEANADITLEADQPLTVKADREHLLRALNNLLKNALQSIPEGRRGKIDVSLRGDGDQAVLSVRDNGEGIPEEARERIFTPSFTTKSSGMGLGLAMVKRIVEQAGGTVTFDSVEGEGTTFIIALPLHAEHGG